MVNRVLFPGRFQPFHLGHVYAIKKLLEDFDEIVIGIGSAQEGFTCRNPFTAGERMEMIKYSLEEEGIDTRRVWIIPIPDIHKPLAWTTYVLGMVPKVDAVASGNPHVIFLYKWAGVKVIEIKLHKPRIYNGTVIRDLIAHGLPWEDRVPSFVVKYIKENGCDQRIALLCSR
ncbi:nicotinamide-nucleotide adenylyltransferase [Desulfurococcaceae archaeon MEX13E-LK6-19]|nr:nicotinamide-nucleotide adenylyltransferase [Desulfurococcaceae archaeon MEX13E-LK6-19]